MNQDEFRNALGILLYTDIVEWEQAGILDPEDDRVRAVIARDPIRWFLRAGDETQAKAFNFIQARLPAAMAA